jgi:sporulation protein YlmC with PRC-barrel domain
MRQAISKLKRLPVVCLDGEVGRVSDFFFDDAKWTVRYLVVDTGGVLDRHRVLITPPSVQAVDTRLSVIRVGASKEAVRHAPDVDTDKPVSRQQEELLYGHYGFRPYWGGTGLWGMGPAPVALARHHDEEHPLISRDEEPSGDRHLRSVEAVTGYRIDASDGLLGQVEDLIIDDETFAIHYLVVDTNRWWFGKKVLIAPLWVQGFDWAERTCSIALSREAVKAAPEYYPGRFADEAYEAELHKHYAERGVLRKTSSTTPAAQRGTQRP